MFRTRGLQLERYLLASLKALSDHENISFISIDLEGPAEAITDLGIAFQRKNDPQRAGHHIVIKATQHTKKNPPKPCGFGLPSEEVDQSEELHAILDN